MVGRRILTSSVCRQAIAALPGVFAGLVLIGWACGNMPMTSLWFSPVSMNPATAVAMLCYFLGLLLCRPARANGLPMASLALLLVAAAIGAMTLADDLFATGVRPDTWLFASELRIGRSLPSRVAPNAALCMILISAALLAARRETKHACYVAQMLAVATFLLSGLALVGHFYHVAALYTMPQFFPMAANTALCFIALGTCVLMQTAHVGLSGILADRGPAGGLVRRLLPAAVILPICFGWLGVLAIRADVVPYDAGIALIAAASVIAMTILVVLTARKLHTSDLGRKHAEHELRRLARTDSLTGLPNRTAFMETLMRRMSPQRRRSDGDFAVISMDLDGFKGVNDTLGHPAGDGLLQNVADHLRSCLRPADVVARLGGDEFTMLLDSVRSAEDAMRVAERVVAGMPRTMSVGSRTAQVGISVGIVVSEARHVSLDAMLSEADQALYTAKQNGRGQFRVFAPELAAA
jgi:diguanylate cyclase (GGDEF)-like protein